MAIDFNHEEEQRERNYGPVPAGSRVLVRLHIEKTDYPCRDMPELTETKSGLLQLPCRFEVVGGTYDGVSWYDNITVQAGMQRIRLTEGQAKSANIGGSLLRAIIEAHRGIDPKATDSRSASGRTIRAWGDMEGMEFPARLGLEKEPYEGKDGRLYWNNHVTKVLPSTDKEYAQIKRGAEFITDGPTQGDGQPRQRANNGPQSASDMPSWDDVPPADDPF